MSHHVYITCCTILCLYVYIVYYIPYLLIILFIIYYCYFFCNITVLWLLWQTNVPICGTIRNTDSDSDKNPAAVHGSTICENSAAAACSGEICELHQNLVNWCASYSDLMD